MNPINAKSVQLIELHAFAYCLLSVSLSESFDFLESNDSEVWIHTSTGESLRTKTKISQWEQQLDDRFLRIHRSYIVNADRVARHTAGAVVVDGRTLEVSRKYRDSVRAAIPESAPSARVRHISNDKPS
mgnify:CR=1 FL=1